MEQAVIDVPDGFAGVVIEKLSFRKGELQGYVPVPTAVIHVLSSWSIRGLIGYRGEFMTIQRANGILNTIFGSYMAHTRGDIAYRRQVP